MIRIRKILDDKSIRNKNALSQIEQIILDQFELVTKEELEKIAKQLTDPVYYQARSSIFVIEGMKNNVKAFALLLHFSDLKVCYLEWISTSLKNLGAGLGGILYDTIKEECLLLGATGLFLEVLPDQEELCPYPVSIKQNQARVKFYETRGARVILNDNFSKKIDSINNELLFLVYDDLGLGNIKIPKQKMHKVITAILERKYKGNCSPEYIDRVVKSFSNDPVQFRDIKYAKESTLNGPCKDIKNYIPMFINNDHQIHHIKEKGYVEAPTRVDQIFKEISKLKVFKETEVKSMPDTLLYRVHTKEYIEYLKLVAKAVPENEVYYPEMFPLRNRARLPKDVLIRSGYYCQDSFTPIHKNVYKASHASAECAYTGAMYLMNGSRITYALCRPPGHHAEAGLFGGFCYINSAAIAAEYLSDYGKVSILDIDFHHGNGTQNIFYKRNDVLTISIHGNPHECFPYFSGFEDEYGEDEGVGFNINYPLATDVVFSKYEKILNLALKKIKEFKPDYFVLSLGLDLAKGDPTGTWSFTADNFRTIGSKFKNFHIPILVVQEGGYHQKDLGKCAKAFFEGLIS